MSVQIYDPVTDTMHKVGGLVDDIDLKQDIEDIQAVSYEHTTINAYNSTVIKISGFKENASSASGETFVLRQRGAETVILTFGNNTQDTAIDTNYHAIRLYKGIGGTPKITKLQFDYTNRVLYVTVASFGALSFAQIAGQKDDLTYETGATVPETDVYDIPIVDIVKSTDLTSSITSGSTAPITSGGVYSAMNTVTSGTGTINTTYLNSGGTCTWRRYGKVVQVYINAQVKTTLTSEEQLVTGLPKAAIETMVYAANNSSNASEGHTLVMTSSGFVRSHYSISSGTYLHTGFTYITSE